MKQVLLFLSQGFEEAEAAAFIDVLGWTRSTEGVTPVDTVVAGLRSEVRAAHSLVVRPQHLLSELDLSRFAALAFPGGYHDRGFTEAYEPVVLDAIRTIHAAGGIIATICVAARPVAAAGLLAGKEATTYPLDGGKHLRYLAEHGARVRDQEVVVSDRIITSTGPATGFTVAFRLLEMLNGSEDVKRIQHAMRFQD
ncbi:MAG: DJ-1/PfpI family protein [Chloroflexi bacterium]|nr:DJ-1/PfpI family protein [Chloroflexota bacterium]